MAGLAQLVTGKKHSEAQGNEGSLQVNATKLPDDITLKLKNNVVPLG